MKTVALVALQNFPLWKMCMEKLKTQVDDIYVRVDVRGENNLEELKESGFATGIMTSTDEWNRYNWRNDLLRMIDDAGADIVLIPDHDEMYDDTIHQDIIDFYNSGKDMMFFDFFAPMPTDDGRIIPELNGKAYPSLAHCGGFRWKPELTYFPYCGLAMPTNYHNTPDNRYKAKTKIKHFCMWTKKMEEEKKAWVMKEYGCF